MSNEEKRAVQTQRLALTDRSALEVTGVQEVLHFDAKFRISWDVGWSIHMASLH